jgi:hypothetical protein
VFSVDPADVPIDWLNNDHVIYVYCSPCPFRGYIMRAMSCKLRIGTRGREEYKKSACGDLMCDLKTLRMQYYSHIGSV